MSNEFVPEYATLGAVLIDPDSLPLVRDIIGPTPTWRDGRVAAVWRAMLELDRDGLAIDPVSIAGHLNGNGDHKFMMGLADYVPSALAAESYAKQVRADMDRRQLHAAALDAIAKLNNGDDVAEVEAFLTAQVSQITPKKERRDIGTLLGDVFADLDELATARQSGGKIGVELGVRDLDRVIGGLRPGDLCYLAGRPGMGKTTVALHAVANIARTAGPVLFYTFEMSGEQLALKLLSSMTRCHYSSLRIGEVADEDWPILMEAANILADMPIVIIDDISTIEEVVAHARRWAASNGSPAAIVADYLQLMGTSANQRMSEQEKLTVMSRQLKLIATGSKTVVLALSQLNRGVESRADKRPVMSDLRGSGSLEQDADQIIMLYRDVETEPQVLELIVRKNRHGQLATTKAYIELETGAILPLIETPTIAY